jgi:hypothetical protein
MKKQGLFLLLATLTTALASAAPWDHGPLRATDNGRYLQHADGTPFFWQGDTCWLLVQKLDRAQVKTYFENRRAKGFNVVQCIAVQALVDQSAYGDRALVDNDITRLNLTPGGDPANEAQYDYWDHLDHVFDTAAANGIYLAVAPTWAHTVRRTPVTSEMVVNYATQLARRYKDRPNLIWLNGGSARGNENTDVWQAIGETIKQHDPVHLMTFHPFGRTQTTTWFNDATWLDLNMFTSGHRRYEQDVDGKKYGEDNWRYVLEDRALSPRRPTLDGEPSYENIPQGLHDSNQPYWTAGDVRRYAWWSVFAGAAGHTYGENSVRQVYLPHETKPASGAKGFFLERLESDGAGQMQHLRNLILSRPFFDRVNDQSAAAGDEGEKYDRILVTRGADYLFAYTHTGRTFTLKLGVISGADLNVWWFNPRIGGVTPARPRPNSGSATFDPPGEPAPGQDWVLVLNNAAKKFTPPGTAPAL